MLALLPLIGIASGALTTVAGLGGGILLLLVLSLMWSPTAALAITAPALLISNLHRFYIFRRDVHWKVAIAFIVGALPGSLLGGAFAAHIPEGALAWFMVAMTLLALSRSFKLWKYEPSPSLITPAGVGIGILTGTSGGAGVLVAPLLIASGLKGQPYVATGALCSVAMHFGRVAAYGASGLVTRETLYRTAILTVALLGGNFLGKRLRTYIRNDRHGERIEVVTLVVCVALSILGLAH